MRTHLAIFTGSSLAQILSGKKTIETRFSQHRIVPFGQVNTGDTVYIKPAGGEIVGQFKVKKVIFYDGLEAEDLQLINKTYGKQIVVGSVVEREQFFASKAKSKFGSLIFIDKVERFITSPVKVPKKDLRGWVVLGQRR